MSTRITQLLPKNSIARIFVIIGITLMSVYPIYTNYYYGLGGNQYQRHIAFLNKESMFFNPWQYRILAPGVIESMYWLYNNTVHQVIDLETLIASKLVEKGTESDESLLVAYPEIQEEGFVRYNIVFVALRFLQHLIIFYLLLVLYRYWLKNDHLILFAICMVSLLIGNSVNDSDLSFNTYFDVIFYLLAAIVIIGKKNPWWILLITVVGAFNRETSLLIPFLLIVGYTNFANFSISEVFKSLSKQLQRLPKPRIFVIIAVSGILFLVIFYGIRAYVGYQDYPGWRVPRGLPMLKLNLMSAASVKSYNEVFGVLTLLPLYCYLYLKRVPNFFTVLLVTFVPIWFGVHLVSVVAYQSRLFLVPMLIIFLPATLWLIEQRSSQIEKNSGMSETS